MRGFRVTVLLEGDRVIVRPEGELDMATTQAFEDAVSSAADGCRELIVDLRRLRFLDSVGLNALLEAARQVVERGGALRLVPGPARVERVFDLTDTRVRLEFVDPTEIDGRVPESQPG